MSDIEQQAQIKQLFDETRRRLVETGTRNRLVHVNRQSRRSNSLDVINERSDDIYRLLAVSRKTMKFMATGRDKDEDSDTPSLVEDKVEESSLQDRYTDNYLETRLGPDSLQKRLLKLARDAKTAEEEQGVNILYLALGFLTWYEDDTSSIKREAPLILLPVELVRNQRTSTYDLKIREDDIVTNLPLQERLKEFGIFLPQIELEEVWTPSSYFDSVSNVVANRTRWKIDNDGMQLGFFSFSKLLMFRDLDPERWPEKKLANHALTKGLLYGGFETEKPLFGDNDKLDQLFTPDSLYHVIDADASQTRVIEEVRTGRNLVVQGPPGTGKSQTITNIIATAVRDGKRVLFVAEKMAALSVVHKRLVDVGLADICLELHSKTANKKAVLAELDRTLNAARAIPNMPESPTLLKETRDKLNVIATELHEVDDLSGETAFSALAQQVRYKGLGAQPPQLECNNLFEIPKQKAEILSNTINRYSAILAQVGQLNAHPFNGIDRLDLEPTDLDRLKPRLKAVSEQILFIVQLIRKASAALDIDIDASFASAHRIRNFLERISEPPDVDKALLAKLINTKDKERLRENLNFGAEWRTIREENESVFSEMAWREDMTQLRPAFESGKNSIFSRWGFRYRKSSKRLASLMLTPLPKSPIDRLNLVDCLIKTSSLREKWRTDEDWCEQILKDSWRGERTLFSKLGNCLTWCNRFAETELKPAINMGINVAYTPSLRDPLLAELNLKLEVAENDVIEIVRHLTIDLSKAFNTNIIEECDLAKLAEKFSAMAESIEKYDQWTTLRKIKRELESANLQSLVSNMEIGKFSKEGAASAEFQFARSEAVWKQTLEKRPYLKNLRDLDRHALVKEFQRLENERRIDCVKLIRASHLQQVPQGAQGAMGIVRSEIGKKRAHIPLRKLFSKSAEAIQRIKPVLMMSPISVAQFLPPGSIEFDLLLIDEASQIRPEDAMGAIARARQIVVVGDQKQLPPSSFFDRLADNDAFEDGEESDDSLLEGVASVGELESILTLCEARGLGSRMLEWHYRSRDPSLIRVSNQEFYKNKLILPPSPLQNDPEYGLIFSRVAGVYDRGGKRDNRIEGESIIERIIEHASKTPDLSLGIVTFSSAQQNLITELLEFHRRHDTVLDLFLREGGTEDVFVKNIENVQGDERDVILVSVGYGPTEPGGSPQMNFGPVNKDGGERRLNVLFTRARVRCEIFCSFDPGDMDLSKSRATGTKVLKRFLEYAKTGIINDEVILGEPDSPFEADVADEIRKMGYIVDHQVGSAGFLIDLGIRHPDRPGTFILAVECDGAAYHNSLWARERDRQRQDVLEHLGWNFHRIWSTDWFYRRNEEVKRLVATLSEAIQKSERGIIVKGAKSQLSPSGLPILSDSTQLKTELLEIPRRSLPKYTKANILIQDKKEPHEIDIVTLADWVYRVVEVEGPIRDEEIARRIASACGKEKAGSRIMERVGQAIKFDCNRSAPRMLRDNDFCFTQVQLEVTPVRDRSLENGYISKATNISLMEIKQCLKLVIQDSCGGSDQEIIREAARLFGFKRVGSELQERMEIGIRELNKERI